MCTYFQIQSLIFGSAPKGFFCLCIFTTFFFYMFGLIGSVKTFSKVIGVGMNLGPYIKLFICGVLSIQSSIRGVLSIWIDTFDFFQPPV